MTEARNSFQAERNGRSKRANMGVKRGLLKGYDLLPKSRSCILLREPEDVPVTCFGLCGSLQYKWSCKQRLEVAEAVIL